MGKKKLDDRSRFNILYWKLKYGGEYVDTNEFLRLAKKLGERPNVQLERVDLSSGDTTHTFDWKTYSWTPVPAGQGEEEAATQDAGHSVSAG